MKEGERQMSYNGKECEGDCSKKSPEIKHKLNNWYEYDFTKQKYVCKECKHIYGQL